MTLTCGDPAPRFIARSSSKPRFTFDITAGRYLVLCFFGSAAPASNQQLLRAVLAHHDYFDDEQFSFFGVTTDPEDEKLQRVKQQRGIRFFWDFDSNISHQYGVIRRFGVGVQYRPTTYVIDPNLRVLKVFRIGNNSAGHVEELIAFLSSLPSIGPVRPAALQAPVLVLPTIFEPEFCRQLIALYHQHGAQDSGFMIQQDEMTVGTIDYRIKRRDDCQIVDEAIRAAMRSRIHIRLVPEIQKAFQFEATRIERYIVARYQGKTGGHFRAHRDNSTKGTAHRRFAVSLSLNAGDYDGGGVRFPEFGRQVYHAPTGGAVVFSCSLLHEAMPVTKGARYVTLPFLYDDAGAAIREQNRRYLATKPG